MKYLLKELAHRGVSSILVEGGSRIITSLLLEKRVDRLVVAIAPMIIGHGFQAVSDLGIRELKDAVRFKSHATRRLGDDIIFDGRL
jgi:riboflavin biosynthesis pyrimidine reductase